MQRRLSLLTLVAALTALSGCATSGGPRLPGEEPLPTPGASPEKIAATAAVRENGPISITGGGEVSSVMPKPEIEPGTGRFINEEAAKKAIPHPSDEEGQVTFNFENQPVQAVVKAFLGDLLHLNYVIAPGVQGNVTFSTSRPIKADQAMSILEMLLSWTNNTLVYSEGRYTVLPVKDAIAGKLSPRVAPPAIAKGYEVRVFPLRFISPNEMQKLLKPYAKADAFVSVDTARSMLVLAGTAAELENYQRTIDIFDVDWLKGMSVGVYPVMHVEVAKLMPELDKLFGASGESPMAGMFRFIPIERTNAVVVITPNREYLDRAEEWLKRLDQGGAESGTQLYVYDVKNVRAADLADYLNQIFTGAAPSGNHGSSGDVAPGLKPVTIGGIGGTGGATVNSTAGGIKSGTTYGDANKPATPKPASTGGGGGSKDTDIRITAIEENNQLLIMATPIEWESIQSGIRRLDIAPLQVHIETKILEVSLTGELQFGVQWYFAGLLNSRTGTPPVGYNNPYERHRSSLGKLNDIGPGSSTFFFSYLNKSLEFAVNALESSGVAKVLSAPSLVVTNNQEAKINVGTQIPVVQTYLSSYTPVVQTTNNNGTNNGSTVTTPNYGGTGQVQYLNTGVILDVKPRVNPGGLVYLEVSQEVSKPGTPAAGSSNPPINQRQLQTKIAVQSGETVLLGGLISEDEQTADDNVPGLSRIPILGRLFGNTDRKRQRTELIVLITPRVIADAAEARDVTDEYQKRFQSLLPLKQKSDADPAFGGALKNDKK